MCYTAKVALCIVKPAAISGNAGSVRKDIASHRCLSAKHAWKVVLAAKRIERAVLNARWALAYSLI